MTIHEILKELGFEKVRFDAVYYEWLPDDGTFGFCINFFHSFDSKGNDLGEFIKLYMMDCNRVALGKPFIVRDDAHDLLQLLVQRGHPLALPALRRIKVNTLL